MYLLSPCKICYCFSQLSISCIFWKTFSFMEYCDCPHTPNVLSILCTLHLMALIILCETVKTWTGVPRSLPATLSWSTPSQNPPTITAQQVIVCIEVFWPTNDERKKKLNYMSPNKAVPFEEAYERETLPSVTGRLSCLKDMHMLCYFFRPILLTRLINIQSNSEHHERDWIFCIVMN